MKPINKDAKLLIRSYIDNIEEYLKTKSRMHPNIIDGILNEINDFIYIRSTELAKEKIQYSDVLKAIEECGSPSDICEQYLEDDVLENKQVPLNKITNEKSKTLLKKEIAEQGANASVDTELSSLRSRYGYFDQFNRFPAYGFYRTCSMFVYLLFFFIVVSTTVQVRYHNNIPIQDLYNFCNNFYYVIFMTFIFFLIEGWVVCDWKNRNENQGFNRIQDDRVVITISCLTILIVSLKASLLPIPEYFFISFPFLFVLLIWMERQQASDLWIARISPAINNLARS
ncbi:MAG: hypothetical protein ACTSR4_09535, partial [Candidatus Hodarchaeales archaeon]